MGQVPRNFSKCLIYLVFPYRYLTTWSIIYIYISTYLFKFYFIYSILKCQNFFCNIFKPTKIFLCVHIFGYILGKVLHHIKIYNWYVLCIYIHIYISLIFPLVLPTLLFFFFILHIHLYIALNYFWNKTVHKYILYFLRSIKALKSEKQLMYNKNDQ